MDPQPPIQPAQTPQSITPEPTDNTQEVDQSFEISHDKVQSAMPTTPLAPSVVEPVSLIQSEAVIQPIEPAQTTQQPVADFQPVAAQPADSIVVMPPAQVAEQPQVTTGSIPPIIPPSVQVVLPSLDAQPTLAEATQVTPEYIAPVVENPTISQVSMPQYVSQSELAMSVAPLVQPPEPQVAQPVSEVPSVQAQPEIVIPQDDAPVLQQMANSTEPTDIFDTVHPVDPIATLSLQQTTPDLGLQAMQEMNANNNQVSTQPLQFGQAEPNLIQPVLPPQPATSGQPLKQPMNGSLPDPTPLQYNQAAVQPPTPAATNPLVYSDPAQDVPVEPPKRSKFKLIMMIIAGVVALVVIGFILKAQVFTKRVTQADVKQTNSYLQNMTSDMSEIQISMSQVTTTDDNELIKQASQDITDKLKDLDSQYANLQKSNVLSYGQIKQKYLELDARWKPYRSYLEDSKNDAATLKPKIIDINTSLSNISKRQDNVTDAVVAKYISTLDEGVTEVKGLSVRTEGFKSIQKAYVVFLQASKKECQKLQSGSGTKQSAVLSCFGGTSESTNAYNKALQDAAMQSSDEGFKLDPSDQISALSTSIVDLIPMLKS